MEGVTNDDIPPGGQNAPCSPSGRAAGDRCRCVRQEAAAGGAAAAAAAPGADGRARSRRRRRRRCPSRPARPPSRVAEDAIGSKSLDELNRDSPLKPVFYALDSVRRRLGRAADAAGERRRAEEVHVVADHDRRPLRRARHGGIQPGARRAPRRRGTHVPGVARHRRRPHQDGQLRQGVPVRSGPRRGGVVEEPPRALRGHRASRLARGRSRHATRDDGARSSSLAAGGRRRRSAPPTASTSR